MKVLRRLRREKDLTQKQLGEMIEMDHSYISNWENGRHSPSVEALTRLSKALECSIDYLVKGGVIMEDLRNQELNIFAEHVPTHDSFVIVVDDKSYRLNEDQFIDLHNKITTALTIKLAKKLGV